MNNRTKHNQQGLTLIELMITVTILSILVFIGSSITNSWVDRSHVNNASQQLKNAVTQAKAAALRNPNNIALQDTAVSLCLNQTQHRIDVIRLNTATASVCDTTAPNTLLQSFSLSKGINIKQNNSNFVCLRFTAAGMLNTTTGSSCSVDTNFNFKVEKNHENADLFIM